MAITMNPSPSGVAPAGLAVHAVGVTRSFQPGRGVLRGLELSVEPGQFVALLGRSGAGKSTLLRILGGLDPEYGGDVLVPQRRAVVFQEPRLIPWARVQANVTLGLRPGPEGRDGLRRAATGALSEVGLAGHARAWPVTLSGGEAQRVALARALVREPQLMLLDEPFGALDALTRSRMHSLLQALCARHRPAVLLVTHDVQEALLLADRAVVLTEGKITLDVPVELARPRDPATPAFQALRWRLLAEPGFTSLADVRWQGRQPNRCPRALTRCEAANGNGRRVMSARRDAEFTEYVTARLAALRRIAYLLCLDRDRADDLVQGAMTKIYLHWGRVRAVDHADSYANVILVREFLSERRSGWARQVALGVELPDRPAAIADPDAALDVRSALAGLPPGQRATIVLRFYCDLNVDQSARVLGCSAGTVKSQTAKGLDALRRALEPDSQPGARTRK